MASAISLISSAESCLLSGEYKKALQHLDLFFFHSPPLSQLLIRSHLCYTNTLFYQLTSSHQPSIDIHYTLTTCLSHISTATSLISTHPHYSHFLLPLSTCLLSICSPFVEACYAGYFISSIIEVVKAIDGVSNHLNDFGSFELNEGQLETLNNNYNKLCYLHGFLCFISESFDLSLLNKIKNEDFLSVSLELKSLMEKSKKGKKSASKSTIVNNVDLLSFGQQDSDDFVKNFKNFLKLVNGDLVEIFDELYSDVKCMSSFSSEIFTFDNLFRVIHDFNEKFHNVVKISNPSSLDQILRFCLFSLLSTPKISTCQTISSLLVSSIKSPGKSWSAEVFSDLIVFVLMSHSEINQSCLSRVLSFFRNSADRINQIDDSLLAACLFISFSKISSTNFSNFVENSDPHLLVSTMSSIFEILDLVQGQSFSKALFCFNFASILKRFSVSCRFSLLEISLRAVVYSDHNDCFIKNFIKFDYLISIREEGIALPGLTNILDDKTASKFRKELTCVLQSKNLPFHFTSKFFNLCYCFDNININNGDLNPLEYLIQEISSILMAFDDLSVIFSHVLLLLISKYFASNDFLSFFCQLLSQILINDPSLDETEFQSKVSEANSLEFSEINDVDLINPIILSIKLIDNSELQISIIETLLSKFQNNKVFYQDQIILIIKNYSNLFPQIFNSLVPLIPSLGEEISEIFDSSVALIVMYLYKTECDLFGSDSIPEFRIKCKTKIKFDCSLVSQLVSLVIGNFNLNLSETFKITSSYCRLLITSGSISTFDSVLSFVSLKNFPGISEKSRQVLSCCLIIELLTCQNENLNLSNNELEKLTDLLDAIANIDVELVKIFVNGNSVKNSDFMSCCRHLVSINDPIFEPIYSTLCLSLTKLNLPRAFINDLIIKYYQYLRNISLISSHDSTLSESFSRENLANGDIPQYFVDFSSLKFFNSSSLAQTLLILFMNFIQNNLPSKNSSCNSFIEIGGYDHVAIKNCHVSISLLTFTASILLQLSMCESYFNYFSKIVSLFYEIFIISSELNLPLFELVESFTSYSNIINDVLLLIKNSFHHFISIFKLTFKFPRTVLAPHLSLVNHYMSQNDSDSAIQIFETLLSVIPSCLVSFVVEEKEKILRHDELSCPLVQLESLEQSWKRAQNDLINDSGFSTTKVDLNLVAFLFNNGLFEEANTVAKFSLAKKSSLTSVTDPAELIYKFGLFVVLSVLNFNSIDVYQYLKHTLVTTFQILNQFDNNDPSEMESLDRLGLEELLEKKFDISKTFLMENFVEKPDELLYFCDLFINICWKLDFLFAIVPIFALASTIANVFERKNYLISLISLKYSLKILLFDKNDPSLSQSCQKFLIHCKRDRLLYSTLYARKSSFQPFEFVNSACYSLMKCKYFLENYLTNLKLNFGSEIDYHKNLMKECKIPETFNQNSSELYLTKEEIIEMCASISRNPLLITTSYLDKFLTSMSKFLTHVDNLAEVDTIIEAFESILSFLFKNLPWFSLNLNGPLSKFKRESVNFVERAFNQVDKFLNFFTSSISELTKILNFDVHSTLSAKISKLHLLQAKLFSLKFLESESNRSLDLQNLVQSHGNLPHNVVDFLISKEELPICDIDLINQAAFQLWKAHNCSENFDENVDFLSQLINTLSQVPHQKLIETSNILSYGSEGTSSDTRFSIFDLFHVNQHNLNENFDKPVIIDESSKFLNILSQILTVESPIAVLSQLKNQTIITSFDSFLSILISFVYIPQRSKTPNEKGSKKRSESRQSQNLGGELYFSAVYVDPSKFLEIRSRNSVFDRQNFGNCDEYLVSLFDNVRLLVSDSIINVQSNMIELPWELIFEEKLVYYHATLDSAIKSPIKLSETNQFSAIIDSEGYIPVDAKENFTNSFSKLFSSLKSNSKMKSLCGPEEIPSKISIQRFFSNFHQNPSLICLLSSSGLLENLDFLQNFNKSFILFLFDDVMSNTTNVAQIFASFAKISKFGTVIVPLSNSTVDLAVNFSDYLKDNVKSPQNFVSSVQSFFELHSSSIPCLRIFGGLDLK
ncbi:hypothetical protein P9112_010998 [Eukaryota sp. TZLM1-RC]